MTFRGGGSGRFVVHTGDCPIIDYRLSVKHALRTVSDDGAFVPGLRLRALVGITSFEELVIHLSNGAGVIEIAQGSPNVGIPPKDFTDLVKAMVEGRAFVDAFTVKGNFSAPVIR